MVRFSRIHLDVFIVFASQQEEDEEETALARCFQPFFATSQKENRVNDEQTFVDTSVPFANVRIRVKETAARILPSNPP